MGFARVKLKWVATICLLLTGCATSSSARHNAPPPSFSIPIIQMNGSPQQIGQTYGQRLGDPMHLLLEAYLKPWFGNDLKRWSAELAASAFEPYIPDEYDQELDAIAQTSGLDKRQLLLAQCFLDLMPATACSTITLPPSASPDGVGRFGRNLDFPGLGVAAKQTVILIYHPSGRYAFAAVGWPGLIGVVSGINEYGLTLANMEVPREFRAPHAMPYPMLYRTLLERCRTVDEAVTLLKALPRQSANNLMLMDAAGNRAVAEITPEQVIVRQGAEHQALASTNNQRGQDRTTTGLSQRFDCMKAEWAAQFGHIGVQQLQLMMRDVSQGDMTLQSMIFEPATRRLYLAVGTDAPRRKYYRLDLAAYFPVHRP